jgi:hypothetical protein
VLLFDLPECCIRVISCVKLNKGVNKPSDYHVERRG